MYHTQKKEFTSLNRTTTLNTEKKETKKPKRARKNVADNIPNVYKINENIICLRVNELFGNEPLQTFTFDQMKLIGSVCSKCGLYRNDKSDLKFTGGSNIVWTCENCRTVVKLLQKDTIQALKSTREVFMPEIFAEDFEYIKTNEISQDKSRLIIFCIDISGSMGGERINSIKENLKKILDYIMDNGFANDIKVAITLFNGEGFAYIYEYASEDENDDTMNLVLKNISNDLNINRSVFENNTFKREDFEYYLNDIPTLNESYQSLCNVIDSLTGNGGACIGDALVFSTLLASISKHASLILCTGGETADEDPVTLFTSVAKFANQFFTQIYIFRLDNCNLQNLEVLSRLTGGKCENFVNLMSNIGQLTGKDENPNIALLNDDFDELVIMGNQNLVALKCLFENQVINETKNKNKIVIQNHNKKSLRDFLVEIQLLGDKNETANCILQIQLISENRVRIASKYIHLIKSQLITSDNNQNEVLINLNAWRYLAYYLLEKKSFEEAKLFYLKNKKYFKTKELFENKDLENELTTNFLPNLEKFDGEEISISDDVAKALGNLIIRPSEDKKDIQLIKVISLSKKSPQWKPSDSSSSYTSQTHTVNHVNEEDVDVNKEMPLKLPPI